MTSEFCFLYITCPTSIEAEKIATNLVESRLAACANILPQMTSIYEWKGKLQKDNEVVLILKTQKSLAAKARHHIETQHSYEVPCILELDFNPNPAYGRWLKTQTI